MNLRLLVSLALIFALAGCWTRPPKLVTKEELLEATKEWKEPEVAAWYYFGSNADHDFFLFEDIDGKKAYRVKKDEEIIPDEFDLTYDRNS